MTDLRRAGYNIDLSAPLDNIPFSNSSKRERIEENVFRNKLEFFAAAKVSSSFSPPNLPEIAFAVNVLTEIKKSLIDPNDNLRNWNKADPCTSNWTGVWCFDRVGADGYFHVRELLVDNNNLSGSLPPEFSMLQSLRILDLFEWIELEVLNHCSSGTHCYSIIYFKLACDHVLFSYFKI